VLGDPPRSDVLGELRAMSMSAVYEKDDGSSVQFALQPAIRHRDLKEVQQLTVTARAKPASTDNDGVMAGLEAAHHLGVRGFVEFTSAQMHGVWQIKRRDKT
jgi:hypothetical protein